MGTNSRIEWTDHTWNPWRGCAKIGRGCEHCYAERQAKINPRVLGTWGREGPRRDRRRRAFALPLKWDREAAAAGVRRRVFCGSMMDWLEDRPDLVKPRAQTLAIVRLTANLDWILLTKRPQNTERLVKQAATQWTYTTLYADWPYDHVCQGISASTQIGLDALHRLAPPAPWRSGRWSHCWSGSTASGPGANGQLPDWVIVGGESGPRHGRCTRTGSARSAINVLLPACPFFFKQWGEWWPISQMPDGWLNAQARPRRHRAATRSRAPVIPGPLNPARAEHPYVFPRGQKAAGRLLDGREHNGLPTCFRGGTAMSSTCDAP